ncbi:hypothetical protein IWQ62_001154 [Dispira parvispora]|uniref:Uncharacterized protein n=1 Tax=Dispira parvispora TaxID=1520584 RepID=A0A9W8AWS6_9FUNG|nr:hypothetical protein IWQ62_001154 [Dispira parvispora]
MGHFGGELRGKLQKMDGNSYGHYKSLTGSYIFPNYTLFVDHVQSDPYASPSWLRIQVSQTVAKFPKNLYDTTVRRIALCDYICRSLYQYNSNELTDATHRSPSRWGQTKGGQIIIDVPGQQVLQRTAVDINDECIEFRFAVNLPGRGRTIMGQLASRVLTETLPRLVEKCLFYESHDSRRVLEFVNCIDDQDVLRESLVSRGLLGFVRNGSLLPRRSGASDLPIAVDQAVLFQSPASLEVTFDLPHRGTITGMGIKRGVTLIAGGGFHGKSTLLQALQCGVYNHIPGDGREFVSVDRNTVKIKAEDGRVVTGTDISPFIGNLPMKKRTDSFSTLDASGSTSMAANIQENLEMGCTGLLFDEDTCATNFLIRDLRMQMLIPREDEPITPLISKIGVLWTELGVSSVLVIGGCGDYLDTADTVIRMNRYQPEDITAEAKKVARSHPTGSLNEASTTYGNIPSRRVSLPESLIKGKPPTAKSCHSIMLPYGSSHPPVNKVESAGNNMQADESYAHKDAMSVAHRDDDKPSLNLVHFDQLKETSQTRTIAAILTSTAYLTQPSAKKLRSAFFGQPAVMETTQGNTLTQRPSPDRSPTLCELLDRWEALMDTHGLRIVTARNDPEQFGEVQVPLSDHKVPYNLSRPRKYELGAAINRLKDLKCSI